MSNYHAADHELDLKLVVALDVLLQERSVTRAAQRLGLTQSAVSHKLRALRDALGDPLLVSGAHGMVLTERAVRLAEPLRVALASVRDALRGGMTFDPATTERSFVIAGSDYSSFMAMPTLMNDICSQAPGVTVTFVAHGPDVTRQLESGDIDLAILPEHRPELATGALKRVMLVREPFVVIARHDHPDLDEPLTLERFIALPHLIIAPTGRAGGPVDHALDKRGMKRRIALRTSHFTSAPFVVAASDLIATVPLGLARTASRHVALRHLSPPLPLPEMAGFLCWHPRAHADPGHAWLRQKILATRDRLQADADAGSP